MYRNVLSSWSRKVSWYACRPPLTEQLLLQTHVHCAHCFQMLYNQLYMNTAIYSRDFCIPTAKLVPWSSSTKVHWIQSIQYSILIFNRIKPYTCSVHTVSVYSTCTFQAHTIYPFNKMLNLSPSNYSVLVHSYSTGMSTCPLYMLCIQLHCIKQVSKFTIAVL